MITDRSEYDFVTIPYSIKVDGGIMPLRVSTDEKELRGEDVGFLMEATAERRYTAKQREEGRVEIDAEINAARLNAVAQSINGLYYTGAQDGGACHTETPLPIGVTYVRDSVGVYLPSAFVNGLAVNPEEWEAPTFEPWDSLNADKIRALYSGLSGLNRFQYILNGLPSTEANRYTFVGEYEGAEDWLDGSSSIVEKSSANRGSFVRPKWQWGEWTLRGDSGDAAYGISEELAALWKYLDLSTAVALICLESWDNIGQAPMRFFYYFVECSVSLADRRINFKAVDISRLGAKALAVSGNDVNVAMMAQEGRAAACGVVWRGVAGLVCDLGDRTRWG